MTLAFRTACLVQPPNRRSAHRQRKRRFAVLRQARVLLLLAWVCCTACGKDSARPDGETADASASQAGAPAFAGQSAGGQASFFAGAAGQLALGGAGTGGMGGSGGQLVIGSGGSAGSTSEGTAGRISEAGAGGSAGAAGSPASAGGGGAQAGNGGSDIQTIHYYGRWNRLSGKAIAVNGGSHVRAQFFGTGVSARFDVSSNQAPNPTLVWRVDQGAWQEGELAATLPLSTGLTPGKHELFLMIRGLNEAQNRWAPPLISAITLLGIDVSAGTLTPTARAVGTRLEFVGDSITEGVAVWPNRAGKDTACWRADGRLGYAAQTSLALNADWRQVGFGGEGVLKPGNGGVPTFNESFNWIYQGVPRDAWQPELVILNVGTVDRTDLGPNFAPAYAKFVSTVRAGYAAAKIVALRPFGGFHGAEIKAEVAARNAAGDTRIYYVDSTGWLSAADYTDGIHPNVQGSAKAALALAAELKRIGML